MIPPKKEMFALSVCDRAMEPALHLNDVVVVDPAATLKSGRMVAARVGGLRDAVVRQYIAPRGKKYFALVPQNSSFPAIPSRNTEIALLGVVVARQQCMT